MPDCLHLSVKITETPGQHIVSVIRCQECLKCGAYRYWLPAADRWGAWIAAPAGGRRGRRVARPKQLALFEE